MKIIKLSKNHRLHRDGYTHALRFVRWSSSIDPFEKKMTSMFGCQYARKEPPEWREKTL